MLLLDRLNCTFKCILDVLLSLGVLVVVRFCLLLCFFVQMGALLGNDILSICVQRRLSSAFTRLVETLMLYENKAGIK